MRSVYRVLGGVLALGCSATGTPLPTIPDAKAFVGVRVTPLALNLGIGQTQQFTVTPVNLAGAALPGLPEPEFSSTDPLVASVTSSGLVTGLAEGLARIIGKIQSENLTYYDTTVVTVTATPRPIATFNLQFAGAGDPKRRTVPSFGVVSLSFVARNSAGTPIPGLRPDFFALDIKKVQMTASGANASLRGLQLGETKIIGSITSDGVTKVDTATLVVTNVTSVTVTLVTGGSFGTFDPPRVTIAPGGRVTWRNSSGVSHGITFDNPAAVTDGNIPAFSEGTQSRVFPTAGTYTYKSTTNGATGTVVVQ